MARPSRVVEHLRLRGESESAVRHVLPALEDGFRTASLPDAGARILCVRRLQLGRLPSNGSAQSVALLIEKRFAEAGWTVVHASDSGADAAEAVWFRDAFEAHETAALKIAAGQTLGAWFWPLALPKVVTAAGDANLRTIAFAIAAMEEAPRALPGWTASLVRAGYRQQLISALQPGDGPALLRAAGVTFLPSEELDGATAVRSHASRGRRVPGETVDDRAVFVELVSSRAGGHSPRLSTRIAERRTTRATPSGDEIGAAPETPARAPAGEPGRPRLAASRRRVSDQRLEPPGNRLIQGLETRRGATRDESTETVVSKALRDRREERRPASPPDAPSERPAAVVEESARAETAGEIDQPTDEPVAFTTPWQLSYAAPTTAGGLLFVLPVLDRVGFAAWAAGREPEEPEPEVMAAQILHLLLSRLRVDENDPVWGLAAAFRPFDRPRAVPSTAEGRLKPEGREFASTGDLCGSQLQPNQVPDLCGFRLQPEGCERAAIWLSNCRRYLRRRVRIGLASLVVRRARVSITPTHVDVFFRLNAADVRVRRTGLDIDPGWVPWFGRVVTFHYEDRPWN